MIIVVGQFKGGVGKSVLVTNLQYYLRKYKPKIVNLDIQNSIVDLNNIRKKKAKPFELIQATNTQDLEKIYNNNSKENLFIIDTIGTDTELTRTALLIADLIISPVSDKTIDILGLMNFQNILADLSIKSGEPIKSYVVINNVSPAIKRFDELKEFIKSSTHFELFNSIIRQRVDVANSVGYGMAVGEYSPNSKGHTEFLEFAKEIEKML